jgi:hypothetical protein
VLFLSSGLIARLPRQPQPPVQVSQSQGFKYFALVGPLLEGLHRHATERDQAGNRQLFYDPYAALLLFYFFNPPEPRPDG